MTRNASTPILLIEDNPTDVQRIKGLLNASLHERFTTVTASTLDKGLKKLAEKDIHVVLLDLGLRDSNGIETFRAVRDHAPSLPILVLTEADDDVLGQQIVQEGAQDYFTKSSLAHGEMSAAMLIHMLHFAIERKQADIILQQAYNKVHLLNEQLEATNAKLHKANDTLEHHVHERTEELALMNEEQKTINERLRLTNQELRRVAEHSVYLEREAHKNAERTELLNRIITLANEHSDVHAYVRALLEIFISDLNFNTAMLYFRHDNLVELYDSRGLSKRITAQMQREHINTPPLDSIYAGELHYDEAYTDYNPDKNRESPITTTIGIPLIGYDQVIGHFSLGGKSASTLTIPEMQALKAIGQEAGSSIARLQAEERVKQYAEQLEVLVEERTTQLKEAERLAGIGQTAAMIGHDLRNPLQALQFSLELEQTYFNRMASDAEANSQIAKAGELFSSMEQQIRYMDKIVSDLQDYARPLTPQLEQLSVAALINNVLALLTIPKIVHPHVSAPQALTVVLDSHLMQRALSNLVTNAIQAMPAGGELTIEASEGDGVMCMTVRDTGEGVADEMRETLFSPLATGKAKGTGLGLAVVKRIIEAHSGTIGFESEEGKGTTFIITLPCVADS